MDLATVAGLLGCTILVLVVMNLAGGMLLYWDFISILVVLGGSLLATLVRFSIPVFINGLKAGTKAISTDIQDDVELLEEIIECADIARKNSILSLEKHEVKNDYLRKSIRYMVDGYDPVIIDNILTLEINNLKERHKDGHKLFDSLGELSPAFGMIGTVIGLIVIMANLSDPSKIGPGLAVALVTTLYGTLLANMFFIPLSSKLKYRTSQEEKNLFIIKEGVKGLLQGENPKVIRARLGSFVGAKEEE